MTPKVTMRAALTEPTLLGNVLAGDTWRVWRMLSIAAMGEELDAAERELFKQLTGGREREPGQRVEELALVIGRRGGKSRAMACLSVYLTALCDHPELVAGETGVLLVIAPDQRQAGITLGYAASIFEDSEVLGKLLVNRTADNLQLVGGINIEVRSSSFRRLRGPTYIGVVADEVAYLYSDEFSSNADTEIIEACRPGLSTTGGPLILCSSPYAKRGVLYSAFKQNYGPDGDPLLLVAKGSTRELNPSLPQRVVDRAYARDEASARAEYGAEFRSDVQSFVDPAVIEAATIRGRHELPPASGIRYAAFGDPSGGSSDSMTVAVGHLDRERIVIVDAVREVKAPFVPAQVVAEFSDLLKRYHCHGIVGDKYGGEWPTQAFNEHGIKYELAPKPKA
jgi:hypothetical protein